MSASVIAIKSILPELPNARGAWVDGSDPILKIIEHSDLPKFEKVVILCEFIIDPHTFWVFALGWHPTTKWVVLGTQGRKASSREWHRSVKALFDMFRADAIWVTDRSVYLALQLLGFGSLHLVGEYEYLSIGAQK